MRPRRLLRVLPALVLASALAACGQSQRTAANYCHVFYTDGAAFRNQYLNQDVQQHPLQGLVALISAPQQLANFFGRLDAVAPSAIEPDVKTLQESYQKLSDNTGNSLVHPLSGLVSNLANGLTSVSSYSAVDAYTKQNCGPPPQ